MTEVKICGLCRPADARAASSAGAEYAGVVLAPGGRRSRTVDEAAEIFAAAEGARRVGVFVDASDDAVRAAAERLRLDVVQLHGDESPERVAEIRSAGPWRVWKAARPRDRSEFLAALGRFAEVADALLLDGWSARAAGGTGTRFPWEVVESARDELRTGMRLVVAGGLTPATVGDAVVRLRPDVVDVSSGVERSPGRKDADRVRGFIERAHAARADATRAREARVSEARASEPRSHERNAGASG